MLFQIHIKPYPSVKILTSYKHEIRFFVRRGNATHELDGKESEDYWQGRHFFKFIEYPAPFIAVHIK